MDAKTTRVAYIAVIFVVMLAAIVAALLKIYYLALGLIVLDAIIVTIGSSLIARMFKEEKLGNLKK
jgi:general stress protein CsbA